jgi:hypothetical protein
MSATYSKTSPYNGTNTWGPFLDVWAGKTIPSAVDDAVYQIDSPYNLRPDLLAYDLYKDSGLWWVFAVRNPDTLIDPLMSFRTGVIIYVPSLSTVKTALDL